MTVQTTSTQPRGLRSRLALIEAIELGGLALLVTILMIIASWSDDSVSASNVISALVLLLGGTFLAWGSYLLFIRLGRLGGSKVETALWIIAAAATASATFWIWSILDINRLIVSKLFYRGEAPVEYAWSSKSKRARKEWEAQHKA